MKSLLTPLALAAALTFAPPAFAQTAAPEQAKPTAMNTKASDSTQIRNDKRAIRSTQRAIAKDVPGSAQKKADRASLKAQKRQLRMDRAKARADARAAAPR